jgi:hypothetical protein
MAGCFLGRSVIKECQTSKVYALRSFQVIVNHSILGNISSKKQGIGLVSFNGMARMGRDIVC